MRSLTSYNYRAIVYHSFRKYLMIPLRATLWVLLKTVSLAFVSVGMAAELLAAKVVPPVLVKHLDEANKLIDKFDAKHRVPELQGKPEA